MNTNPVPLAVVAALVVAACNSSTPQLVSGRAATSTFPYAVTTVTANRAGQAVAVAPIGEDGSFSIRLPAGAHYRLELGSTAGRAGLVFPRASGTLATSFDVRGHQAPFDVGVVRFVGDPASHTYKKLSTPAGGHDGECENGVDRATGAVCVDDTEGSKSCGASDGGVACQDGIDPMSGMECDGGPGAPQNDGEDPSDDENPSDGEDPSDDGPADAAVADKNLPSAIGCDDANGDQETND